MSALKLLAWVTVLVVCVLGALVTLVHVAGDVPLDRDLLTPLGRVTAVMYATLAVLPLALAALRVTTLRVGICWGIVVLATVAAINAFPGDPGPLRCPSGHCPDPGTSEYLRAQATQAKDSPVAATVLFVVVIVLGFSALGITLMLQAFVRRQASSYRLPRA